MTPAADIIGGAHGFEVEVNDISHGSNRLAERSAKIGRWKEIHNQAWFLGFDIYAQ
jgi:hypothetical protein